MKKASKVSKASTVSKATKKKPIGKSAKKKIAKMQKKDDEILTLHLHHEVLQLDPVVPRLPDMPEPPEPAEMGICKHCHLLPAAAYELVIVLTCLTFSLSAVLLTSTQTIERQQSVISTLQKVKMEVYVRR